MDELLKELPKEFHTDEVKKLLADHFEQAIYIQNKKDAANKIMYPVTRWNWKPEYNQVRDKIEIALIAASL